MIQSRTVVFATCVMAAVDVCRGAASYVTVVWPLGPLIQYFDVEHSLGNLFFKRTLATVQDAVSPPVSENLIKLATTTWAGSIFRGLPRVSGPGSRIPQTAMGAC